MHTTTPVPRRDVRLSRLDLALLVALALLLSVVLTSHKTPPRPAWTGRGAPAEVVNAP